MTTIQGQIQTPPYDKRKLFDAYIKIVAFQRRIWEASLEMFHKRAADNPFAAQMTRSDVMNVTAPHLFGALRVACILAVDSGIACLLDPEISMNDPTKPNLVLKRVIEELGPSSGTSERAMIDAHYAKLKDLAEPIRASRNKIGAHLDLPVALAIIDHDDDPSGQTPYPLRKTMVGEYEKVMALMTRITDAIVASFRPGYQWYDLKIDAEVDKLFSTLLNGVVHKLAG